MGGLLIYRSSKSDKAAIGTGQTYSATFEVRSTTYTSPRPLTCALVDRFV